MLSLPGVASPSRDAAPDGEVPGESSPDERIRRSLDHAASAAFNSRAPKSPTERRHLTTSVAKLPQEVARAAQAKSSDKMATDSEAVCMRLVASAVIGCAADLAIGSFNAGDLDLLFIRAGLGAYAPGSAYGKSALVSNGVQASIRAAAESDEAAIKGLNQFVLLVAERIRPAESDPVEPGTPFWKLREAARSDGFDLRPEYSSVDSQRFLRMRFLPPDEPLMPLSEEITALEDDFVRLGLTDALTHYRQAVKVFVEQDFEGANGQLRTMFEAVVTHVAVKLGFVRIKAGGGGQAIAYLVAENHLPLRDGGDFVQGLWSIVHPNGPHPGTTTAGEVHFRLLTMTGAARYLIDRFQPRVGP